MMLKMLRALALVGALGAGFVAAPLARAQESADEKIGQLIKKIQEHEAKRRQAFIEKRYKDAIAEVEEILKLFQTPGLGPQDVRMGMAICHMNLAICHAQLGETDAAVANFEKSIASGFRDWVFIETEEGLAPIRNHPRFKKAVAEARNASAAAVDDNSVITIEEAMSVGALGGCKVNLKMTLSDRAYASLKTRMSPWANFQMRDGVPALGEPSPKAVLRALEISTLPVEIKNLEGSFDDANRCFTAKWAMLGVAKNVTGTWKLPLPGEGDVWTLAGVKDDVATLTAAEQRLERVCQRKMVVSLPKGASEVRVEKRPNRLCYKLPAYQVPNNATAGIPDFKFECKPHIATALYKLYGDPGHSRFWVARSIFQNKSKDILKNYRVRFRITDFSSWSPWERCDTVYPSQVVCDAFYPVIDSKVRELKSTTPAVLEVEYEYERNGKKVTSTDSSRFKLLGMNDGISHTVGMSEDSTWHDFFMDIPELYASFAAGDDPVMSDVAGMIQKVIGGRWSNHSREDALKFLEALYNILRCNVAYEGARGSFANGELGQVYKYGRDVLRTKSGTCVNLAIFYASVCEAAGFDAILFHIPQHTFPGVRLPDGSLVFVETTGCGGGTPDSSADFEWALKRGELNYLDAIAKGYMLRVRLREMRLSGVTPPELPDPGKNFLKEWDIKPPVIAATPAPKPATPSGGQDPAAPAPPVQSGPMPFNPFAEAEAGDWACYHVDVKQGDKGAKHGTQWEVLKIEDGKLLLQVQRHTATGKMPPASGVFPKSETPPLELFVPMRAKAFSNMKTTDEKLPVGGRSFACKKLTFVATLESGEKIDCVVWFSKVVKLTGVVQVLMTDNGGHEVKVLLAGYGTHDSLEWGKRVEDIVPKPEPTPVPPPVEPTKDEPAKPEPPKAEPPKPEAKEPPKEPSKDE